MEYGKPQKLPDGRYFLRISGIRQQVNGLVLQDSLTSKSINFKVPSADYFNTLDQEILTQAKASKMEWFGKDLSDDTIAGAYQESVTDDILGASLVTIKGEVATVAYDAQKNSVELQSVAPDTKCDVVLELAGLWFLKKSFGPIWRAVQVRTRTGTSRAPPREYMFSDDAGEDEDDPNDFLD